ncbi:MAG TPA: SemiSWEET transporter [Chitinophagaceae bacterium]|nr:SemiSWEET transporter [Chitinophagaceae bacterium]
MNFIPILGYIAAVFTTGSFLPQAVETIRTRDTEGISFYMYLFLVAGQLMWVVYASFTRDYPLLAANAITSILAMIILYFKIRFPKHQPKD